PLREERDLHLGRAGVGLVEAVLGDRGGGVWHRQVRSLPAPAMVALGRRWMGDQVGLRVRVAAAAAAAGSLPFTPRGTRTGETEVPERRVQWGVAALLARRSSSTPDRTTSPTSRATTSRTTPTPSFPDPTP